VNVQSGCSEIGFDPTLDLARQKASSSERIRIPAAQRSCIMESRGNRKNRVVMMTLVRAMVVLGVLALIAYGTYAVISGTTKRRTPVADAGPRWVAAHYAVNEMTRIVVRRLNPGNGDVLDEHMVVEIPDSDSDFDAKFLEAMAEARARAALFESESD
jgi:hypothetical protein